MRKRRCSVYHHNHPRLSGFRDWGVVSIFVQQSALAAVLEHCTSMWRFDPTRLLNVGQKPNIQGKTFKDKGIIGVNMINSTLISLAFAVSIMCA